MSQPLRLADIRLLRFGCGAAGGARLRALPTLRLALEAWGLPERPGRPRGSVPRVLDEALRPCGSTDCRHCHLCPEGELRARRKAPRAGVKAEMSRQDSLDQDLMSSPLALSLAQMLDADEEDPMPGLHDSRARGKEEEVGRQADQQSESDPFKLSEGGLLDQLAMEKREQRRGAQRTLSLRRELLDAARIVPSEGSKLHGSGLCRPCAWFWKPKGCENGKDCRHCHLCPQEEIKNRRKVKQMLLQNEGNELDASLSELPDASRPQLAGGLCMGRLDLSSPLGWDAFGASPSSPSPEPLGTRDESPKFAIELANCLPVPSAGRPCAWFHKASGCSNGDACAHCHLCPEARLRRGLGRGRRGLGGGWALVGSLWVER
ncbi:unnamed protein product [Effrenium voratum]|uniref:C3H1-type domain-containing protein n=1 Tax=Effrenium voratum TaxID=2562239 RepID=A0AA36HSL2_9DINO|nr:unnamed protein product [Effrenium voratum]